MEIGFDAPVNGVVKEVRARRGQQVAAGDVLLVIEESSDSSHDGEETGRLELFELPDRLAGCSFADGGEGVSRSQPRGRCAAAAIAAAHSRRRARRSCACCSATTPTPRAPRSWRISSRHRSRRISPRASSGSWPRFDASSEVSSRTSNGSSSALREPPSRDELGPSNNARLRMFVRRMRAEGAGIADEFLRSRAAASHCATTAFREPASLATRWSARCCALLSVAAGRPELRHAAGAQALIRRVSHRAGGARSRPERRSRRWKRRSNAIGRHARPGARMPLRMPPRIDANYAVFQRPRMETARRAAAQQGRSKSWLASDAHRGPQPPPPDVLLDLVRCAATRSSTGWADWIAQGYETRAQTDCASPRLHGFSAATRRARSVRTATPRSTGLAGCDWARPLLVSGARPRARRGGLARRTMLSRSRDPPLRRSRETRRARGGAYPRARSYPEPTRRNSKLDHRQRRTRARSLPGDRRDLDCRFTLELLVRKDASMPCTPHLRGRSLGRDGDCTR